MANFLHRCKVAVLLYVCGLFFVDGKVARFFLTLMLDHYSKLLTTQAYMQGMGRHSIEDVRRMIIQVKDCLHVQF